MRIARISSYCLAAVLACLWMTAPLVRAQSQDNPKVTRLLEQARDEAAQVARDADEMQGLVLSNASWLSHAEKLDVMRDHVNSLGKLARQLEDSRNSASPWQQQAIDRMLPLLRDLATNTTAAINHLNKNKERPTTGNYKEYLNENAETARELSNTISNFVKYGETRAKMEKLEQKIEVASSE